ncbi:hypothetical protein CVT25_005952 [Psilocybe cyanescens]|uniref:Large ribosomal subunit protein mL43 n=1 Tax=Psilocybe cyanescens TaxID=93625 RepID=A0A409VMA5_PSICY|nr:hypothetical protein CVT25_005952 [Psilocybe cyanescens]
MPAILLRASLRSRPTNGHAAYLPQIRKLVFEYCDKWPTSANARIYINTRIEALAKANPHVELVVKQRNHKEPIVRGFYVNNRDKVIPLKSLEVTGIHQKVQLLLDSSGAKIVPLKRRAVESTTESPRGPLLFAPLYVMMLTTDDLSFPLHISSDELTWLQASAILDDSPILPPKDDDDIFMQDLSLSSSADSFCSPLHLRYAAAPSPPIPDSPRSSKHAGSLSPSPRGSIRPNDSPRSEWIYRRPKSSINTRHRPANTNPYPRPSTGYKKQTSIKITPSSPSASILTTRTATVASSRIPLVEPDNMPSTTTTSTTPFWSNVLRARPRSERSIPLLKTIPSESQIVLSPLDLSPASKNSTPKRISAPKSLSSRPPSISSTLSSMSNSPSPSSSRSESPVTPSSLPSFSYSGTGSRQHRRQSSFHRRHRTHPDSDASLPPSLLSQSCPPSKSILARTSSVSTKGSSHTVNKSVKFAAIPTVHYAIRDYWAIEPVDRQRYGDGEMGINIDAMDEDDQSLVGYRGDDMLDAAKLRELQCTTPTPEREKIKAKGLKRLMSLSKRSVPTTGTSPTVGTAHNPPLPQSLAASTRPVISTPYPLGTSRAQAMQSTLSLRATHHNLKGEMPGSALDLHLSEVTARSGAPPPLRTAPSCESFRSSKSAAARSIRSLGSVKSTSSTRGFRAWLGRTVGWTES